MTDLHPSSPAHAHPALDDYCPVCRRPDDYCEICGGPHDRTRPHARVPGEEITFTREDAEAVAREAAAWEGSFEYETGMDGIRAHTALLRALAAKINALRPPD
jgi:hypothetical protein